jgi:hypothetical protein
MTKNGTERSKITIALYMAIVAIEATRLLEYVTRSRSQSRASSCAVPREPFHIFIFVVKNVYTVITK